MIFFYLEPSALLKRYRREIGTDVMNELFWNKLESELFFTSYLSILEVMSVATRYRKGRLLKQRSYRKVLESLNRDAVNSFIISPIADPIVSASAPLILKHALSVPDSLHLATILSIRQTMPETELCLVASDQRLTEAAKAEGFLVMNPEQPGATDMLRTIRTAT